MANQVRRLVGSHQCEDSGLLVVVKLSKDLELPFRSRRLQRISVDLIGQQREQLSGVEIGEAVEQGGDLTGRKRGDPPVVVGIGASGLGISSQELNIRPQSWRSRP
jgi:hypothetical protein